MSPDAGATAPRAPAGVAADDLKTRILDALPQTQCTRCGFPDCAGYAQAVACGEAAINQCPPGGAQGVARLAEITGQPVLPLSAEHGVEQARSVAWIDETWCIGCTLCLAACPVDAIVGAHKRMHTVIEPLCTGCELCVPVCPVDCIALEPVTGDRTGWAAWSADEAAQARARYAAHQRRLEQERQDNERRLELKARAKLADLAAQTHGADDAASAEAQRKRILIEAALARARTRQASR